MFRPYECGENNRGFQFITLKANILTCQQRMMDWAMKLEGVDYLRSYSDYFCFLIFASPAGGLTNSRNLL